MSFVLSYSFESVGFILADTRLNITSNDGRRSVSDANPLTVGMKNGMTADWGSQYRKMSPIINGYCAFAGEAITGRKILDVLIDASYMPLSEVALLVSSESQRVAPWLPKGTVTENVFKKSSLMMLNSTNGRVNLSTMDMEGTIQNQDVNYATYWPPEIPNNIQLELNNCVANVDIPQSLPQLYELILSSLQLFQQVHQNSHTVSRTFEIGILIPQTDELITFYGSGDSEEIIQRGVLGVEDMLSVKRS